MAVSLDPTRARTLRRLSRLVGARILHGRGHKIWWRVPRIPWYVFLPVCKSSRSTTVLGKRNYFPYPAVHRRNVLTYVVFWVLSSQVTPSVIIRILSRRWSRLRMWLCAQWKLSHTAVLALGRRRLICCVNGTMKHRLYLISLSNGQDLGEGPRYCVEATVPHLGTL